MDHGPIYVWRDEKLVFKGTFVNGKRQGDFVEFDAKGRIVGTTTYIDGRPLQHNDQK
jgi:hypothetical protein